jgi:hypothetical protein
MRPEDLERYNIDANSLHCLTNYCHIFPLCHFHIHPCLPLPNPDYLRLHAAVYRVAHLSGAAGDLDREDRESERRGVLARDGSSAALLASRLAAHVAPRSGGGWEE